MNRRAKAAILATGACALYGAYEVGGGGWWSFVLMVAVAGCACYVVIGYRRAESEAASCDEAQQAFEQAEDRANQEYNRLRTERAERQSEAIEAVSGKRLEEKLEVALFIGRRPEETESAWIKRKNTVVQERARLWRDRDMRYGISLLELVEAQGGLCGDPGKDRHGHGCGCWLYAMPPGTVHVDHITPQAAGGSDAPSNLQALCQSCNLSKGSKTGRGRPKEGEEQPTLFLRR